MNPSVKSPPASPANARFSLFAFLTRFVVCNVAATPPPPPPPARQRAWLRWHAPCGGLDGESSPCWPPSKAAFAPPCPSPLLRSPHSPSKPSLSPPRPLRTGNLSAQPRGGGWGGLRRSDVASFWLATLAGALWGILLGAYSATMMEEAEICALTHSDRISSFRKSRRTGAIRVMFSTAAGMVPATTNTIGATKCCPTGQFATPDTNNQCFNPAVLRNEIKKARGSASPARVATLLEGGHDPNTTIDGIPALIFAATIGHAEIVSILITAGATANARDSDQNAVPHVVAINSFGSAPLNYSWATALNVLRHFADAVNEAGATYSWTSTRSNGYRAVALLQHRYDAEPRVWPGEDVAEKQRAMKGMANIMLASGRLLPFQPLVVRAHHLQRAAVGGGGKGAWRGGPFRNYPIFGRRRPGRDGLQQSAAADCGGASRACEDSQNPDHRRSRPDRDRSGVFTM